MAARLAQEQAEAEARRRHDQEVATRRPGCRTEDRLSRWEAELEKLETDMKAKSRASTPKCCSERARRSRRRKRARRPPSRAVEREEKASAENHVFRRRGPVAPQRSESSSQRKGLEKVASRAAKHLEVTIASKCSSARPGHLDAQHAEVAACLQDPAKAGLGA